MKNFLGWLGVAVIPFLCAALIWVLNIREDQERIAASGDGSDAGFKGVPACACPWSPTWDQVIKRKLWLEGWAHGNKMRRMIGKE